ncbi:MAG: hypothetical protein K9J12_10985 [Melioribacteraceae bacterium]|nr:hypothetical protein [Melioribacteraceae bacterium]MCF8265234.1 hypothetical protein [Melioribacteraceae bacterium]MCF8413049.1 hypothetical protein [Melioribacteraceae bacterium]MCF8432635.1 hypothetical protein [Melioribacteraceae bacterium]
MLKPLNRIKAGSWIFIVLILTIYACDEKPPLNNRVVARVGDYELTDHQLDSLMGAKFYSNKIKNELIRQWIEKQMVYSEAVENNVLESEDYKFVIGNSEKELAAALHLKVILGDRLNQISERELKEYFDERKSDFRLNSEAFSFYSAEFYDKQDAINFRKDALNDWQNALTAHEQKIAVKYETGFDYDFNIEPVPLLRVLNELYINEVSVILNLKPRLFTVVQLKDKFTKGDIPSFESVKSQIRKRLEIQTKKDIYKEYIDKLYSKYEVEINEVN